MAYHRTKPVPATRKPSREPQASVLVSTTKLTAMVTKQVAIEVPSFQVRQRRQVSESRLIAHLSDQSDPGRKSHHTPAYTQNIKFLAHGGHLHAIAGCSSIYRLMSKSEYQKFRAWADKFFGK